MPQEIWLLLSALGVAQSLFFAIYVVVPKETRQAPNLLLAAFFIAIAVRTAKSLLWAYWDPTPLWVLNAGFAAHLAIGPLLWLYTRAIADATIRRLAVLHFLPMCLILGGAFRFTLTEFWYAGAYLVLLIHNMVYVTLTVGSLWKQRGNWPDQRVWRFTMGLTAGAAVFGLAYFSNFVLGWSSYLTGPVLYSIIAYGLSYYAFRNQSIFRRQALEKYRNLRMTDAECSAISDRLQWLMTDERVFLSPDLNVARLAELASISPYVLSSVLSRSLKQNFSEFVNTYRIEEAKRLLADDGHKNQKIASIAYACGYNSLSVFNAAFRKLHGVTPSEFRSKTTRIS